MHRDKESNHKSHVVNSVEEIKFKFKFIYSHLYSYNTTTIRKKKEVKTELTIH